MCCENNPLVMDGKGTPGGGVRVVEDSDGDGRYEKARCLRTGLENGLTTQDLADLIAL